MSQQRRPSRITTALIVVAISGLAVSTILGFFGGFWWVLDLFSHFRVHYAGALLVMLFIGAILRFWKCVTIGALALLINLWLLAPFYLSATPDPASASPHVKLMQVNVHTTNTAFDPLADYIRKEKPDIVSVQEMTREWRDALRERLPNYRVALAIPQANNLGIGLFVRRHADAVVVEHVRQVNWHQLPMIEATLVTKDQRWHLLSAHTVPPIDRSRANHRDAMLHDIGQWVQDQTEPCIVIGDLNATPWSYPIRRLRAQTGLRHSRWGFGLQGTWPADLPVPGEIPIDHCLHDGRLVTLDCHRGPVVGSDHRPLVVTLALKRR